MKGYFGLVIVLMICSYLSPKESYEKYFQFVVGTIVAVMLMKPLCVFLHQAPYMEGYDIEQYIESNSTIFEQEEKD